MGSNSLAITFAESRAEAKVYPKSDATRCCGGTPHSCGSEPAQVNILPDKSCVPAKTVQLDFGSIKMLLRDHKPCLLWPRIVIAVLVCGV
jgi:hypothetical protein